MLLSAGSRVTSTAQVHSLLPPHSSEHCLPEILFSLLLLDLLFHGENNSAITSPCYPVRIPSLHPPLAPPPNHIIPRLHRLHRHAMNKELEPWSAKEHQEYILGPGPEGIGEGRARGVGETTYLKIYIGAFYTKTSRKVRLPPRYVNLSARPLLWRNW